MNRLAIATTLAIGTVASAAGMYSLTFGPEPDYTSIPPSAAEMHDMLESNTLSLSAAIKLAEQEAGGLAFSAFPASNDNKSLYEIMVYNRDTATKINIDLETGKVIDSTTTPRFPGEPVEGDWIETESGLKYYDLVIGSGELPAGETATVTVHYTGWLVDGTKFDSSYDRGQPISFQLNKVIRGWIEGVGTMRVGGKRKLIIPFELGYGMGGRPGSIPPKATLIFDVELVSL